MKILVLSDSHGNVDNMVQAAQAEQPDMIFHLGDCWRDAEYLHRRLPELPLVQVPGNCDYRPQDKEEILLELEGKRLLLCHGHTYGVKSSLMGAGYAAEEKDLDLFLFGHTHRPLVDQRGKTLFVNPGTVGMSWPPTYAVVTLDGTQTDAVIRRL